jgi:rhodanese-related sulfurtransferase
MNSKKIKLLSVIMVLVVALGLLAGCGAKTEPAKAEPAKSNVVSDGANAYFSNMPADIYKISEKDFIAKVKANESMFVLDIRQKDVYDKGHIKGAVNLPWGTAISDNLEKLPKDKPIMVYCYTGQTAGQTVALLNVAGFNAKSVNLGWDLGISKADGVTDVTETKANQLSGGAAAEIKPEIKAAIAAYYKGLGEIKDPVYKNYKISEDEAKKLVDTENKSVVFLSVRKAEDFAKGHIEGAINIPFGKGMENKFNTLPKDKKIVVYCYTGQTAGQTVAILRLLGYDAVSLNAGTGTAANAPAGWINKGFPVVK